MNAIEIRLLGACWPNNDEEAIIGAATAAAEPPGDLVTEELIACPVIVQNVIKPTGWQFNALAFIVRCTPARKQGRGGRPYPWVSGRRVSLISFGVPLAVLFPMR